MRDPYRESPRVTSPFAAGNLDQFQNPWLQRVGRRMYVARIGVVDELSDGENEDTVVIDPNVLDGYQSVEGAVTMKDREASGVELETVPAKFQVYNDDKESLRAGAPPSYEADGKLVFRELNEYNQSSTAYGLPSSSDISTQEIRDLLDQNDGEIRVETVGIENARIHI